MSKGRKSIYETKIKPKFQSIKSMLEDGATERQVAEALGIAYSTFNKYKVEKKEFAELLKNVDHSKIVSDLRGALLKKALGFREHEERTTVQKIVFDDDGTERPARIIKTELLDKYFPPDVAAINLALKNYDKENWSNDWQMYGIKKEELEIKKKMAEQNTW